MAKMIPVALHIEKETEKAFYIQVKDGECHNVERFTWIPKSVCSTTDYVATYNALNEPETYDKMVTEIAEWWAYKNKII